jgi:hypothetical protein
VQAWLYLLREKLKQNSLTRQQKTNVDEQDEQEYDEFVM